MSEELIPKSGPNSADSPETPPEDAKIFGYNVAQQSKIDSINKPNPNSPLAAG
jgi:hypothetical protein